MTLSQYLDSLLSEAQILILSLYYGLNKRGITLTITELSKLFNVSTKKIQLHLDKIRETLTLESVRSLIEVSPVQYHSDLVDG